MHLPVARLHLRNVLAAAPARIAGLLGVPTALKKRAEAEAVVAAEVEADDRAIAGHLAAGELVRGIARQARVAQRLDPEAGEQVKIFGRTWLLKRNWGFKSDNSDDMRAYADEMTDVFLDWLEMLALEVGAGT